MRKIKDKINDKFIKKIKIKINDKFKVEIDYDKSIKYFNQLINKDKDIERIYEKIKEEYSERLKKGTLNIKYEKLKIQERQGKLKGSGEDFQFSYFTALFSALYVVLLESLCKDHEKMLSTVVLVILVFLIREFIKKSKPNRSINMTLAISLMVLDELEKEQDNKLNVNKKVNEKALKKKESFNKLKV